MALDTEGRRQDGVRGITAAEMAGSRGRPDGGDTYSGVNLPTATYENPGPTANLRGIEPNTNWGRESEGPYEVTQTFGSEVPRGTPPTVEWNASQNVVGDSPQGWQSYDSASNNQVQPDWPQHGSFTNIGEMYPGNPGNYAENGGQYPR